MNELRVTAFWNHFHPEQVQHAELRTTKFDNREEAEAFVATLPKALKLRVVPCTMADNTVTYSAQSTYIKLMSDGVNGGRNEAGVKRIRTALRAGAVYHRGVCGNAYDTLEDFVAAAGV